MLMASPTKMAKNSHWFLWIAGWRPKGKCVLVCVQLWIMLRMPCGER